MGNDDQDRNPLDMRDNLKTAKLPSSGVNALRQQGRASLVGTMLDGRYLIERELGAGGIGAVYLARDLKVLGRNVVIKVLLEQSFQDEYVVKKFRQEAEALSRVDHPSIIAILDTGELPNGQPYLVLQYIEGVTLRSVIKPGGIALERAAQIVRQVAHALTAAHDKGILHRDLKPENIMLQSLSEEDEQVMVIDFGIARIENSVIAPKTAIMATAGTIAYMSPEQLCADNLSPASDTYSLGVIAYELATGRKPYNPKSPYQLLEMQRNGVAVMPRDLRSELPEQAQEVILRALKFDAAERFRSTREFGSTLLRAMTGGSGNPHIHTTDVPASGIDTGGAPTPHANASAPVAPHGAAATTRLEAVKANVTASDMPHATHGQAALTGRVETPPVVVASAATTDQHQPGESFSASAKSGVVLKIAAAIAVLALAGGIGVSVWQLTRTSLQSTPHAAVVRNRAASSAPQPQAQTGSGAGVVGAPTILKYSITVQRVRGGKEFKEPFQSTGREIFENGWEFRLNVLSPKEGYLYLVNEGLNDKGAKTMTVLFPIGASARLVANKPVQIPPAPQYYYFTGEAGTEKIWMAWSATPVAELERVKEVVNPKEQGEISKPDQINSVQAFLTANASPQLEVVRDTTNKETDIKADGNLAVHLIELEHQ